MKKLILVATLIMASLTAYSAEFEASLWSPTQLQSPGTSIDGVRLGLLWTVNQNVEGLDLHLGANKKANFTGVSLGGIYDNTTGNFTGLKIPFLGGNKVGGDMTGVQFGGFNNVKGHMTGLQMAAINFVGSGEGAQFAFFNKANSFKGLQVGLVNYTRSLNGVQIGFVNIAKNSQLFEVLPFFNFNLRF